MAVHRVADQSSINWSLEIDIPFIIILCIWIDNYKVLNNWFSFKDVSNIAGKMTNSAALDQTTFRLDYFLTTFWLRDCLHL